MNREQIHIFEFLYISKTSFIADSSLSEGHKQWSTGYVIIFDLFNLPISYITVFIYFQYNQKLF